MYIQTVYQYLVCESMSRFRFTLEKDYELFLNERAG